MADEPMSEYEEALEMMITAWRARDWLEQHGMELDSDVPCSACLGVARAVLRGRQGPLLDLACADARQARRKITEAFGIVMKLTGDVLQ